MKILVITIFLIFLITLHLSSQVKLPRLISDGMVLQRDSKINIWGWASNNETVTVRFIDSSYTTTANNEGEWSISLPPLRAGGPFSMQIKATNEITIGNILIGDVWLCSGQSQMDINMERVSPLYTDEIKNADNENIRYFSVPQTYNFKEPQSDLIAGTWEPVTRHNILKISAVAYFFATDLYKKYNIPIGIIRSSQGGSPIEAWLSEDAIKAFPVHESEYRKFQDQSFTDSIQTADRTRINAWYTKLNQTDQGYENPREPWYKPEINTKDWKQFEVPGYWTKDNVGETNGVIWFRKEINLPESMAGKPAKLCLGRIIDSDSVFVNGVFIGSTGYMYPPRRYNVPPRLLKKGKNIIVIRLINSIGKGGFVPDKPYELVVENQKTDLQGKWQYRIGARSEPLQPETAIRYKPVGLYNAMIDPLTPFRIKGFVWYQGESNVERPAEYGKLLPALINNWRNKWNAGDLPFLFVQLHNYMESKKIPGESNWALTREAQTKALSLPETGMAVAIDLGEWNDIHPLNKKDVAKRLSLVAQKIAYNDSGVVCSGPLYQSMEIKGNKIIISFTHIGKGLVSKDGRQLKHFAVAGSDRKFVWAKAIIDNNKVIVWNNKITHPIAVRYAWADNPEGANLYNAEGLPASPFRTDNFK